MSGRLEWPELTPVGEAAEWGRVAAVVIAEDIESELGRDPVLRGYIEGLVGPKPDHPT